MNLNDFKMKTKFLINAAFAEFGHFQSAKKIIREQRVPQKGTNKWEKDQAAMTFAESGEFDTAREIMDEKGKNPVHYYDECQYGDNDACYSHESP